MFVIGMVVGVVGCVVILGVWGWRQSVLGSPCNEHRMKPVRVQHTHNDVDLVSYLFSKCVRCEEYQVSKFSGHWTIEDFKS